MKQFLTVIFFLFCLASSSQDKTNYVHYNKLIEVKGTTFVIATIEHWGKMMATNSQYLLFIDTRNGKTKQVDFPKDTFVQGIDLIRIDSLGINTVLIAANTVNLDANKSIDWNDPKQIILLSPDGQEKIQVTEDRYFVRTWTVNSITGTLIITGHYDSNNNGKYDKTDKNEILVYDLKTKKLVNRI
jgi:hypothetical protein